MSKEFVDAMATGNNLEAEAVFKTAMASKIGDALETKRSEVAKTFVKQAAEYVDQEADVND
mgnify:CR=1 FL=1|tara:strand:+ start:43 stop:225 length:183 start_codon:yes stop_codon:yes gene_type:complete